MKTVLLVDTDAERGIALNAAFILGMSLGARPGTTLGPDVLDADGLLHSGITAVPVPVLGTDADTLARIAAQALAVASTDMLVIDFSRTAQTCASYSDYENKLAGTRSADAGYLALTLRGPRKVVERLTRNLPLLR